MAKENMDNTTLRDELIKQFKSQFPEDSPLEILSESELAKIPGWITTGNHALNWMISKDVSRGLPMGRVILLTGDAGTGKSMIALSMMREPSIDLIVYFDTEGGGISEDFGKFLGIDTSKVLYQPLNTVEELKKKMGFVIDIIEKNKAKKNVLMVIDSISMLTSERELDDNAGADMGNKAKQTREFFRRYVRKMQKLNIACVMTGHLTSTIGGYGPSKEVTGGTVLQYAPSAEVRFARVNAESEVSKDAKGASLIKIRGEMVKSRFGTYGKRVKFDLDMERGLNPYAGLFDILKDYEFVIPAASDLDKQIEEKSVPKRSTGWWVFKPFENKTTQALHEKMMKHGLTSSGKWRESSLADFCKEYDWFLGDIQNILDHIYDEPESTMVEEKPEIKKTETTVVKEDDNSESENKSNTTVKKTTKKKAAVAT